MKGLHKYIDRHGKHFTVELALSAAGKRWNKDTIEKAASKKVYYNVTEATLGDIVFLTNYYHLSLGKPFNKCIDYSLSKVSDYSNYEGNIFIDWIVMITCYGKDFDFTPYI